MFKRVPNKRDTKGNKDVGAGRTKLRRNRTAVFGAILSNKNSNILQMRKLQEEHYVTYIEVLHNLASDSSEKALAEYACQRDKLFLVGSEQVVKSIIAYENNAVGQPKEIHDKYLTDIVKAIRKDYPTISLQGTNT